MSEAPINLTVHGLICHRDTDMAITGLGSLLKFSDTPLQLVIHNDGSLTSEDRDKLLHHLPGSSIIDRPEADERMAEHLKQFPNCTRYRTEHIYSLKLLDVALLSQGDFAFCDSDILFLRPYRNLFSWPDAQTSAMFMQDYINSYSMLPWTLLGKNKPKLPSKVNSGLILFRKKKYDLDFIEWFLGQETFRHKVGWLEQTCWAAVGRHVGCRQWNPEQIVLMRPWTEDSPQVVAGHFVKESRYRMGEFVNLSQDRTETAPRVTVNSFVPDDCNLFALGAVHANRQLKRAKNYRKIFSLFSRQPSQ